MLGDGPTVPLHRDCWAPFIPSRPNLTEHSWAPNSSLDKNTKVSLENCPLKNCLSWTIVSLENCPLENCPLDNCLLGQSPHGQLLHHPAVSPAVVLSSAVSPAAGCAVLLLTAYLSMKVPNEAEKPRLNFPSFCTFYSELRKNKIMIMEHKAIDS